MCCPDVFDEHQIDGLHLHVNLMSSQFRRFPSLLANLPLRLLPFSSKQQAAYDQTGFVQDVAFKTVPRAGKVYFHTCQVV